MFKIVFTGGGTAGHVTPNLAIINEIRKTEPNAEIHYIGSDSGLEKSIVEKDPSIIYHQVRTGKFRRYFSFKNVTDFFKVLGGRRDAKKLMKQIKPDVLFSKGGYVSVPVVYAAGKCKVPVLAHESDITPGLANKLSMRYATKVCVTFKETIDNFKSGKGIYTGTPIREALYHGDAQKTREELGFDGKPVLLIMGGSLGSVIINDAVRANLGELTKRYNIIHLCGKGRLDESPECLNNGSYRQFEFVTDKLPDFLACGDVYLSRAGSNAIHEFLSLKKPMLLIPLSKKASRGDQILNAENFKSRGLAHVLPEEELNAETLLNAINETYEDRDNLIKAMSEEEIIDGTQKITSLILAYAKGYK